MEGMEFHSIPKQIYRVKQGPYNEKLIKEILDLIRVFEPKLTKKDLISVFDH